MQQGHCEGGVEGEGGYDTPDPQSESALFLELDHRYPRTEQELCVIVIEF